MKVAVRLPVTRYRTFLGESQRALASRAPYPPVQGPGPVHVDGATTLQPSRGVDPQVRDVTQPAEHQRTSANVVEKRGAGSSAKPQTHGAHAAFCPRTRQGSAYLGTIPLSRLKQYPMTLDRGVRQRPRNHSSQRATKCLGPADD